MKGGGVVVIGFCCLVFFIAFPKRVIAQTGSSTVEVRVVDASGSAWPRGTLALINTSTFELRKAVTDLDGVVEFKVPEGQYVAIAADQNQCIVPAIQRLRVGTKETVRTKLTLLLDVTFKKCGEVVE